MLMVYTILFILFIRFILFILFLLFILFIPAIMLNWGMVYYCFANSMPNPLINHHISFLMAIFGQICYNEREERWNSVEMYI